MAKPEVKITITETGSDKAAAGIGKVDQAADKASKGGLQGLADRIPGMNKVLGEIPGGTELASGGISALGAASVAGGAALVAFAAKGVQAFSQTTVEVGKFRDATGTTSEEASRFVEVFNDLGIGADTGAAAIGKMEKALGTNADAFSQYGVDIVKAKDGTIDAQGTFLNAVDALNKMKDPAQRAAAGAAMFGKGWQAMSEIIGSGSDSLRKSLESVAPSKVFSDKDINSGRDVRDSFDAVRDSVEGLQLSLGKNLAPAVATASKQIAGLVEDIGPLVEKLGQLQSWKIGSGDDAFAPLAGPLPNLINGVQELAEAEIKASVSFGAVTTAAQEQIVASEGQERSQKAVNAEAERWTALAKTYDTTTQDAAQAQRDLAAASDRVERSISNQERAWQELKGEISDEQAWLDMQSTFDDVKAKGQEAFDAVKNNTADADAKMREYQSSVNTAKSNVIDLGQQLGLSIPTVKDMLLQIDDGAIDQVEARLRTLTRNRTISLDIQAKGGAGYDVGRAPGSRGATGGIVRQRQDNVTLGEAGPEAVIPLNRTPGSSPLPGGMFGGGMTVNINMPAGSNGDDVVRAIKKYERTNGTGWRS